MVALAVILLAQAMPSVVKDKQTPPVPPNVRCVQDSFGNLTCTDGSRGIRDSFGNVTVIPGRR
jgi:hypothetical protein